MRAARVSRRTTLRGAAWAGPAGLVAAVLAGCDAEDPGPGSSVTSSPSATDSTTAPATDSTAAPASPDEVLVRRAVDRIGAVAAATALTARRRPRLAGSLVGFAALHAAHRRALGVTAPPALLRPEPPVPRSRRRALAGVVGAEEELSAQLAFLAQRCESGELARLLAAMAAGVHQRVVVLDPGRAPGSTVVPPLPRPARRPAAEVAALQRTLAAEHAAVYVDGVLGAQTSQTDPATAPLYQVLTDAYDVHLARREELVEVLAAVGAAPTAAAPAYDVPARLDRARVVRHEAGRLEGACAAEYAYLVAQTAGPTRRWAIATLRDTAVRELAIRGTPETFPGADEFADR